MTALFVTGSHTDVGKTHVACALLRAARSSGRTVAALKPVVSGFDPEDWAESDPGRLLAAMSLTPTPEKLEAISPWRFAAPLAPPIAARRENRRLALADLIAACAAWLAAEPAQVRLIEGVGGVMSPIADDATGLDLMTALRLPNLLVGGTYLGAISHTLTAVETLRSRSLTPALIVISQSAEADAIALEETVQEVLRHAPGIPLLSAPRGLLSGEEAWTAQAVLGLAPEAPQA